MNTKLDCIPGRIRRKIDLPPDGVGCWMWTASRDGCGYGMAWWMGRTVRAHRLTYHLLADSSFEVFGQKATERQVVDHLCRNTACVNPSHLRIVSNRENTCAGLLGVLGDHSSSALGVHWNERARKWEAQTRVDGRSFYLGVFTAEIDAARAYDAARKLIDGSTPNLDAGLTDTAPTETEIAHASKKIGWSDPT